MSPTPSLAQRSLRFGVMCPGPRVEAALAAAVRELLRTEGLELALVIEDEGEPPAPRSGPRLWDAYLRLRPMRRISAYQPVDLSDAFAGVPTAEAHDIESIRDQRLDFILLLGFRAVRGELLDAPTHGVWSFNLSAEPLSGGAPPGFWEVYLAERATGAFLQRLTEPPHDGVVLQRCFVSTRPGSYKGTLDEIAWASAYMPARVARDILNGTAGYLGAPPSSTPGPLRQAPTSSQTMRFLARKRFAWIKAQLKSIFMLERFHVGIVRRPIESFLSDDFQPVVEWLPYRKSRGFLADPFLVRVGGTTRLLMEEWDDRSDMGSIVEVDLDEGLRGRRPSEVFGRATHMSYPYLFEYDGRVVCTPESKDRHGVFLYVLDADGRRWTEHARLLEGFAALDPTLIHHGGHWWLFCGDENDDPDVKLKLWHSPELLGPWEPHPANPVKADVRSSRPAGTPFVFEGELYRPAQDSAGGYGRAVVINRVTLLTTTEFAEEPVVRFTLPPGSRYTAGAHTLAGLGDLTAVDGKRLALAPQIVGPKLLEKLGLLVGRGRG